MPAGPDPEPTSSTPPSGTSDPRPVAVSSPTAERAPQGPDGPSALEEGIGPRRSRRRRSKKNDDGGFRGFFRELPVLLLIAFVLALLIKTFLVQAFYIP